MKVKELIKLLKDKGWNQDRIRGSHHVFIHSAAKRSITIPVHNKEIPDFYAKSILKQAKEALKKR